MQPLRVWKLAVFALGVAQPLLATAGEPGPLPLTPASTNQQIADLITRNLNQSGQLRNYNIDVAFLDGTAEMTGTVTDQIQREEALRVVQGTPGVVKVRDRLTFVEPISRVHVADTPPQLPPPLPGGVTPPAVPGGTGAAPEPTPIFQAPPVGPYDLNPPKMPPYAWPTYAPYNNFSRVAYPLTYPYESWPFIGPCYPFPKIPPGWRKVTLQWVDGHWWFGPHSTSHDWWRMRFW